MEPNRLKVLSRSKSATQTARALWRHQATTVVHRRCTRKLDPTTGPPAAMDRTNSLEEWRKRQAAEELELYSELVTRRINSWTPPRQPRTEHGWKGDTTDHLATAAAVQDVAQVADCKPERSIVRTVKNRLLRTLGMIRATQCTGNSTAKLHSPLMPRLFPTKPAPPKTLLCRSNTDMSSREYAVVVAARDGQSSVGVIRPRLESDEWSSCSSLRSQAPPFSPPASLSGTGPVSAPRGCLGLSTSRPRDSVRDDLMLDDNYGSALPACSMKRSGSLNVLVLGEASESFLQSLPSQSLRRLAEAQEFRDLVHRRRDSQRIKA